MERSQLDKISIEQLRTEAERYGLPTTGDQQALIDRVMTHLERNGPMRDLNTGFVVEVGANEQVLQQETREEGDEPVTASKLRDVLKMITADMMRQQQEMQMNQLQFMRDQQQQFFVFARELSAARREPSPASNPTEPRTNGSPRLVENANGFPANLNFSPGSANGLGTGNSVK